MPLEPIHVMEMDRSTSRLELTRVNPTRQFIIGGPGGAAIYQWQNGHWYDTAGNPLALEQVPAQCLEDIRDNPVKVTIAGAPEVTKTCTLCGLSMNAGDWDEHMVKHVHDAMADLGRIEGKSDTALSEKPGPPAEKYAANTHAKKG